MTPLLRAVLAAALFGASTPIAKRLLAECGPLTLAGLLYLGGALATLPGARLRRARSTADGGARKRDLRLMAGAVLLGGLAGPALLMIGLSWSSAADVSLLLPLESVFTALLAMILFREHLGPMAIFGVTLGVAANLALTAAAGVPSAAGAVLVSAACVCWAFDNHWTARIESFTPATSAFWKGAIAGGANLALGLTIESGTPRWPFVLAALACGAAAYGWSITLYVQAAREMGATRAQSAFSAAPIVGVVLAALWLDETLAARHAIAAALFAGSLALIARSRHRHPHTHPEIEHEHAHRHDDGHHGHDHGEREGCAAARHSHRHRHARIEHEHPHWPDDHHRHEHEPERRRSG